MNKIELLIKFEFRNCNTGLTKSHEKVSKSEFRFHAAGPGVILLNLITAVYPFVTSLSYLVPQMDDLRLASLLHIKGALAQVTIRSIHTI